MSTLFRVVKGGGVTSAQGFMASGIAGGIKAEGKDIALVVADTPAEVAATFTTNQVKAPPVRVSMQRVKNGKIRGVVLNAGNANACTGVQGVRDAVEMTELTANALGCADREILVCSTGRIGVPLPMPRVRRGIKKAVARLSRNGAEAAQAIMTSDTHAKEVAVSLNIDGKKVTIGGMAKGAGMIHPKMATMLAVITTDAVIDPACLRTMTFDAVETSFNCITIDGDTSTNDTVIVLANGMAKNHELKSYHPQLERFQAALFHVMHALARMIVEDGEGISRVVEVMVKGAHSHAEAKIAATAIARSQLVKCSWCGGDPNWGRIMDAIGYSDARINEELVSIYYDGLIAVSNGLKSKTPVAKLRKILARRCFSITIDLHIGAGEYSLLTTDLTEKYVEFNKGE